jgi:serine protease inhibitor
MVNLNWYKMQTRKRTHTKLWTLSSLIVLTLLSFSCEKNKIEKEKELTFTPTEDQLALVQKSNQFAFAFTDQQFQLKEADQNILLSPLSVQLSLGMTLQGAQGQTATEMAEAIRMRGVAPSDLNAYFKLLATHLPHLDAKTELAIANSIWYKKDLILKPSFIENNESYYQAAIEGLDFTQPSSKDKINQWVKLHTKGKIDKIVEQIPSNAALYLINAVYFNGVWQSRFNADATQKRTFHVSPDKQVSADFMTIEHSYHVFDNEHAQGIELPYGNGSYSMLVLLPKAGKTVKNVVQALKNGMELPLSKDQRQINVRLYLPKFKFAYEDNLNETLEHLGMPTAFTSQADFGGILEGGSLKINEVKHKTFIEVDERGTQAAAVTSVSMVFTSLQKPEPMLMDFNKPFLVFIREAKSGLILFSGQVYNPLLEGKM